MSTLTLELENSFDDIRYHLTLTQMSEFKGFKFIAVKTTKENSIIDESIVELEIENDHVEHTANMLELMVKLLRNWQAE